MRKSLKACMLAVATLLLLLTSSCHRDDLCYDHPTGAKIAIQIDWKKAQLHPNGATVKFYRNGQLYRPSSEIEYMIDPCYKEVYLPVGDYSVLVFNETPTDLTTMEFRGEELFETFQVAALKDPALLNYPTQNNLNYHYRPDTLAADVITHFAVTQEMLGYDHVHPTPQAERRPDQSPKCVDTLHFEPKRVISVARILVHVNKLGNARSAKGNLRGMSSAYHFATRKYSAETVNHYLDFDLEGTTTYKSTTNGMLTLSVSTWGLTDRELGGSQSSKEDPTSQYMIDITFLLKDDTKPIYSFDYSNKMKITDHIPPHRLIDIEVGVIDLPDVKPTEGDMGLDPDVEDWKDETVDLPM